jgi:hypothetical protein
VVVVTPTSTLVDPEIPVIAAVVSLPNDILGTVTCDTVEYGPKSKAPSVVSSGSDPGIENSSALWLPHALSVTFLHSPLP